MTVNAFFGVNRISMEIDDSFWLSFEPVVLMISERDAEIFIKMLNDPGQLNDALKKVAERFNKRYGKDK